MTSPRSPAETRLVLIGAAVLLSLGMGIRQSFGLLLTPVTRDLALTAADFTLAVAVQNIVWGLSQAPVGAIADRFGLRADSAGRDHAPAQLATEQPSTPVRSQAELALQLPGRPVSPC